MDEYPKHFNPLRAKDLHTLAFTCGLILILAVTLFPYRFSFNEHHNLINSFRLASNIESRRTDLLIGVDGELRQPFKGSIDDIRIYRRALTAAEIAHEAEQYSAHSVHGNASEAGPEASYSFDESPGAIVNDSSGNHNDGLLTNDPERRGGVVHFNGSGQYVRVPSSPSIDISGKAITISVGISLEDSNDGVDQVILGKPWIANSMEYPPYQYAIEFDANEKKSVDFYFGDTSGRLRGPFRVVAPLGVWVHVAFVYDGSLVRGYVSGREQLSTGITDEWKFGDIAANILLFVPFGYGLCGLISRRRFHLSTAAICTFVAGALLSVSLEILQVWLPARYPSLVDVGSNAAGALIGSAGCFFSVFFSSSSKTER